MVDFSDDDDDDDDDADPYYEYDEYDEMEEETSDQNNTSFKFLLAGGIAGAGSFLHLRCFSDTNDIQFHAPLLHRLIVLRYFS